MNGYTGRILTINLSTGEVSTLKLSEKIYDTYIGGRGLAAKLLWDSGAFDFSPEKLENPLIFATGALTGTNIPSSGRVTVSFKSPVTNFYCKSVGGGHWGAELKYAGYDALVVTGKAQRPVYVWIDDDAVVIRDAKGLWGKTIIEMVEIFEQDPEYRGAEVASIGPSGEKQVAFASVVFSSHSFAGRGGGGALMGQKNLKAIVVRGSGFVKAADSDGLMEKAIAATIELGTSETRKRLSTYGTSSLVALRNEMHLLPAKNFLTVHTENGDKLSGQYLLEAGYSISRSGCFQCGTACHKFSRVKAGKYAGTCSAGPEFESVASLGLGCGLTDTDMVLKANELCNTLGMDTVSAGGVIQWAMESFERGVITLSDTDGLDLSWGNGESIVKLLELIAKREGIGDVLAQGTKRACEIFGQNSWQWGNQVKGLETSRAELRVRKGYALGLAVNPRGPDHLTSQAYAEMGANPEALALIRRICGDESYAQTDIIDKRGEIVKWHEACYSISDSLGLCTFATLGHGYLINPERMAEFYNLTVGRNVSGEDLLVIGERIFNLEKAFNVLSGATREDDHIPWRFMNEPVPSGPYKGMVTSADEMKTMIDEYYELHGWERDTGLPKRATLENLGLTDVIEKLESRNKLR